MNKKNILTILTIVFWSAIFFASCESSKPIRTKASFTTVIPNEEGGNIAGIGTYRFLTDDSLILEPANSHEFVKFDPKKDKRVIVYFEDADENVTPGTSPRSIIVKALEPILTKDVLFTERIDSLGNNSIIITDAWFSGGFAGADRYLTLMFSFRASGSSFGQPHIITLAVDKTNQNPVTEDGYYCMEFRHKNKGEIFQEVDAFGYMSCPLPEEVMKDGIKGLVIRYNDERLGDQIMKVDFPQ